MKVLITESKRDRLVIKWLNDNYGDLIPYKTDKHRNYIFFMKNGEVIFEYNKIYGWVYISYDKIWSFLISFFGLNNTQIQDLTKKWVEEQYKLDVTATLQFLSQRL
jgi:hypothetical protein